MQERLFSPYWYRVAALRPRLRAHVRIHRHVYRGDRWYVLENPASQQQHRFTPGTHFLVALMDGERSVAEIWDAALDRLGDEAPTQGEVIALLAQLHDADAILCDVSSDTSALFEKFVHYKRQKGALQRWKNPLYVRLPLWDPEAWLEAWSPRMAAFFTRQAWIAWCGLVLLSGVTALKQSDALLAYGRESLGDPRGWVLMALLYVVVKALHELGHAFAAKHWGAPVHEIGLMFIIGMPIPYVDASATSVFPEKRARMAVAGAGVIVELALASLALWVWLAVAPGALKLAAFQVMAIGGVSTLLFNGNPLIRFDGYYVLADWLEIPNLATRANRHLRYLAETGMLGLEERRGVDAEPSEVPWLVTYGVLAFVYRIFLTVTIALFVAGKFFSLGVALAIWSVVLQVLLPAWSGVMKLWRDPRVAERPLGVAARGLTLVTGLGLLLFAVPLPVWTVAEGVVWLPKQAQVRTGSAGVLTRVLAEPGSVVPSGQPLFELEDPILEARVRVLEARVREARASLASHPARDRVGAEVAREELASVRAELDRARDRLGERLVRAGSEGRFVLPRAEDLVGRFFEKGAVVGYLEIDAPATVRLVVKQDDVASVRSSTGEISVWFPGRSRVVPAVLEREVPRASDRLPSLALGSAGGGGLAVDVRDQQGLTALESLFQFDVLLQERVPALGLGGLAWVRFDHGHEPVGFRAVRAARRLFMRRLHV